MKPCYLFRHYTTISSKPSPTGDIQLPLHFHLLEVHGLAHLTEQLSWRSSGVSSQLGYQLPQPISPEPCAAQWCLRKDETSMQLTMPWNKHIWELLALLLTDLPGEKHRGTRRAGQRYRQENQAWRATEPSQESMLHFATFH